MEFIIRKVLILYLVFMRKGKVIREVMSKIFRGFIVDWFIERNFRILCFIRLIGEFWSII